MSFRHASPASQEESACHPERPASLESLCVIPNARAFTNARRDLPSTNRAVIPSEPLLRREGPGRAAPSVAFFATQQGALGSHLLCHPERPASLESLCVIPNARAFTNARRDLARGVHAPSTNRAVIPSKPLLRREGPGRAAPSVAFFATQQGALGSHHHHASTKTPERFLSYDDLCPLSRLGPSPSF